MIRFNNDYNHGAHPAVLEALTKTNDESYGGYGLDIWCERAAEEIKKCAESPDAAVHFLIGGTQTNYTVIAAALRPYQGCLLYTSSKMMKKFVSDKANRGKNSVMKVQGIRRM